MFARVQLLASSLARRSQASLMKASTSTTAAAVDVQGREPDALYRSVAVEVTGSEPAVLKSYQWFATTAAGHLGITVGHCWAPAKAHHERRTLLKSIHVYKKHRVQYEVRTYTRHMTFERLTGSTADTFLEYIQRNLPEGVAMKVTKEAIEQLPAPVQRIAVAT